jgi:hypothetical protein
MNGANLYRQISDTSEHDNIHISPTNEACNMSHISWDKREYILKVCSFIERAGSDIHLHVFVT